MQYEVIYLRVPDLKHFIYFGVYMDKETQKMLEDEIRGAGRDIIKLEEIGRRYRYQDGKWRYPVRRAINEIMSDIIFEHSGMISKTKDQMLNSKISIK
jgi:hypothetical protein